jgi:hypothetical protein
MIIDTVRTRRATYTDDVTRVDRKPVFIGESGLHSRNPTDAANVYTLAEPGARTGVRHAIWAGAVSGAMNARMLWWEDGYDRFHIDDLCVTDAMTGAPVYPQYSGYAECTDADPNTKLTLRALYADAAAPVAAFVQGVDYAGFVPVTLTPSANLFGAALGDDGMVLGWVKDASSVAAANWTTAGALSGETVTLDVAGSSADWLVDFYDTATGVIISTIDADQDGAGDVTFTLPDFTGSIAFKVYPVGPLTVTIDIIPSGTQNRINVSTPGFVPVHIFSAPDFDAGTVDPATVRFGPPGAPGAPRRSSSFVDIEPDGDVDYARMRFRKSLTGFACGDTVGEIRGETTTGRTFIGTDAVEIRAIPPC